MQHCPYCRVTIAGDKICCPLCGGRLSGKAEPETEVFPALERPRFTKSFTLRLLAFLTVIASAISVLVNIALSTRIWWSLFVVAGAVCFWCAVAVGIAYRRDITQNIGWQIVLISVLSVLWDFGTGWRGWSLDFVLPCVCTGGLLTMLLVSVLLKIPVRTFAGPYLAGCCLGLTPLIFIALDKISFVLPSLICAGVSIILVALLAIFEWQTVKAEFMRRFHL